MFRVRPEWPTTPDFHLEFGLLCPSPRLRRSMRLAVICVMAGMAIGATAKLGVAQWRDNFSGVTGPTAGPSGDQSPANEVAPGLSEFAAFPSRLASDTYKSKGAPAQSSCKDLSTSFLNPTCRSERPHARHAARAAYRVATVIIGRATAPPPPAAAADAAPTTAAPIDELRAVVGSTNKARTLMAQSVGRSAQLPKKPKATPSASTILDAPAREPGSEDVGTNAYASAPWLGRDHHARFPDPFRAAALPPNYRGPFGMFW
jgi:hypothetical protein